MMNTISKEQIEKILISVNKRMLNLKNDSIDETCPIGIIDFTKWEWPQGVGLYGMYQYYKESKREEYLQYLVQWFEDRIKEGLPEKNVNTMAPMLTLAHLYEITEKEEYLQLCQEWAEWVSFER